MNNDNYVLKCNSITWSIEDFQQVAEEAVGKNWEKYYDKNKFEDALHKMIKHHDPMFGITWDTVAFYLQEYCRRDEKNI